MIWEGDGGTIKYIDSYVGNNQRGYVKRGEMHCKGKIIIEMCKKSKKNKENI